MKEKSNKHSYHYIEGETMRPDKKKAIIILSVFMLFAVHLATAASASKKDEHLARVKKESPVTQLEKKPRVTPVHSPVAPVEKKPQVNPAQKASPVLPVKTNQQAAPIKKTSSATPLQQPKIKTPHRISVKKTSLKGFCCINRMVKNQLTNRECSARKGSWYGSLAEANKQCQLLSGYCIVKNNVILPTSQKRCDQLRGTYFKTRPEAQSVVVKNRQKPAGNQLKGSRAAGFCNAQGKTIPNITKLKCKHLKGTFYDQARPALLAIAKEKQQISGAMVQTETQESNRPRSAGNFLPQNGKVVGAIATTVGQTSRSGHGERVTSEKFYPNEISINIRDPFLNLPQDGMFYPFEENLRTPLPEGVAPGKIPGLGNRGNNPGRDHWAREAERIWNDPNSGWLDYMRATLLWLHVDNDIDQRSGIPRDGSGGGGDDGGGGIHSGYNSSNDDDDSSDDSDDNNSNDDSNDEQEDDQGSDTAESDDGSADDDQEEATAEDSQTGGDRGGRGGDGPSLSAQLSDSMSIDPNTGRKKHQRVTGGGSGGGHVSTPVTQPGKGDEHQTNTPDILTEPEDTTRTGEGIRPVVQFQAPDPEVGPNAQPGADYEEDGPGLFMNNGNPVLIQDWIIDDPRVDN